jgi:hypothetical protein
VPVRQFKYKATRSADHDDLVKRLAHEWAKKTASTATEPVILEEKKDGVVIHVYVVWSDWAELDREQRGDVIMEAAERVIKLPGILDITIAMGLTPDEADRFKLKWH